MCFKSQVPILKMILFYNIIFTMRSLIVDNKFNNKKLDKFLFSKFNGLTYNTFFKALRKKDIRINDIKVNENVTLNVGDKVSVYITDDKLFFREFNVIYEDNNILVIDKPQNLETTGDNSLTSIIKESYGANVEPCHRLDRNTSGLVIFAKNSESLNILLEKFKNMEIEKHYKAKVYGIPKKDSCTLTAYLFKDKKKSIVYISDTPEKGYSKIITSYKILEKNLKENYSILDVTLHTGKTHQIRAHLAHIGHPIIGDGKYGNNEINKKFGVKSQELDAYKIIFNFSTDAKILNYLKGFSIQK